MKRKMRKLLKRVALLIALFGMFMLGFSVKGNMRTVQAESGENLEAVYKYYTCVSIQSGDSLWSIAEKYSDDRYYTTDEYIEEIKQINDLKGNYIQQGQYLSVPYYSSEQKM